jgi:hypothetical protein
LPSEQREVVVAKFGFRDGSALVAPGRDEETTVVLQPYGPPIEGRITFDETIPEEDRVFGTIVLCSAWEDKVTGENASPRELKPETFEYRFWPVSPWRYAIQRHHKGLISTSPIVQYTALGPVRADIHVQLEPPYVAGVVVRKDTGAPAAGVPVDARCVGVGEDHRSTWGRCDILNGFRFPRAPGNANGMETGSDGRFLLTLPRSSERIVATVRAGSREAGRATDLTFEFRRDTAISDLRLELLPSGAVEGLVLGKDGKPAARELVAAYDGLGVLEWALSREDGRYHIDGLRPGNYLVLPLGTCAQPITGAGLSGADYDPHVPLPSEFFATPVEVRSAEVANWDIDLRLDSLGRIRGTIREPLPAEGTIERAFLLGGAPLFVQGLHDQGSFDKRRFDFENLWPGKYILWVEESGSRLAEAHVETSRGTTVEVSLEPPRAALLVPIEITGVPPSSVPVIVDFAQRWSFAPQGLGGERDWESWTGFRMAQEGTHLRVEGLPPGRVRVRLVARGYMPAWSEPVEIRDGAEVRAPAVSLANGSVIRVHVATEEGVAMPERVEFCVRPSGESNENPGLPFLHERVPGAPVWNLSAFTPGEYEVAVSAPGNFESTGAHATVSPDRDLELTVVLRRR